MLRSNTLKTAILLHNPRCLKSRDAHKYLSENNINFEVREYLKDNLALSEVKEISRKLNLSPIEFMRTNESIFKENNLKDKPDDKLLQAIVDYPILIERPILIMGDKAAIGRPLDKIKLILKK